MEKVLNVIKINESLDSFRREWSLEPDQNPKLKESICIIKISPIKWIKSLTLMDTDHLPPYGKSVEFY